MPRRLLYIPRHALRLALFVVVGAILIFIALTRTQVGRDRLRDELQRQFAGTFEGRLVIDRLTGNLINDLFASDVRIYDPAGQLVVHIDSVVVRPRWSDLFMQRASFRSLTLIRPEVYLTYDGTWNFRNAFRRTLPNAQSSGPWSFTSAEVEVRAGRLHTYNDGTRPHLVESNWLFDFTETVVSDINLQAIVEWEQGVKLIDVLNASASFTDLGLRLHTANGQVFADNDVLTLNQVQIGLGDTQLRIAGTLDPLTAVRNAADSTRLDFTIEESRFNFDELRRILPRLPLADTLHAGIHVQGLLNHLTIEELDLQHGASQIQASGILSGLPTSLEGTIQVDIGSLSAGDLRSIFPDLPPLSPLDSLGAITFAAQATGHLSDLSDIDAAEIHLETLVDVSSAAGHVAGHLGLQRDPQMSPLLTLDLNAEAVDVGHLIRDEQWNSRLNGHLSGELSLSLPYQGKGRIEAQLSSSILAGRSLDTLRLNVAAEEGLLISDLFVRQRDAALFAGGAINLKASVPAYRLDLTTHRLDLGSLLQADSLRTALDIRARITGTGITPSSLGGTLHLAIDSSMVRWGTQNRFLPASQTSLTLDRIEPDRYRLEIGGDVVAARFEGFTEVDDPGDLIDVWGNAFADALARRRLPRDGETLASGAAASFLSHLASGTGASTPANLDSLSFEAELTLKRPEVVESLFPAFPRFAPGFRTNLRMGAHGNELVIHATARGSTIEMAGSRSDSVHAVLHATASLGALLEETLTATFTFDAASVQLGGQVFPYPHAAASYEGRQGEFSFEAGQNGLTGPFRLITRLDLLSDRTRLTIRDFYLALGEEIWTSTGTPVVDLYADARVIPGLTLEGRTPEDSFSQRLHLHGVHGGSSQDTLFAEIDGVSLLRLSELFSLKRPLGGKLDGHLALTGTSRPELTGQLSVDAITFGDRLLGRLDIESRYLTGTSAVALDLTLHPLPKDFVDPTGFIAVENRLRANGRFRLATGDDPGALDIAVRAERADAFFFEYLFPTLVDDVRGAIVGEATIRGTFRKPIFGGRFGLSEGHFALPAFNLAYQATGTAHVNGEGIHIDGVELLDETGGKASVSGSIGFNDYRFFSLNLTADMDELQVIDVVSSEDLPFYGRIWASGVASLTGPLSSAFLRADDLTTNQHSELFIPLVSDDGAVDPGFIVFTDSTGATPNFEQLTRRDHVLDKRPTGERSFLNGLGMDLNIFAEEGSTVHLIIDPLLGDVINAVGSGRIQLQLADGDFSTYGQFTASSGDYLFTAGEVFVRRFLIEAGTITWDGDPVDARLDLAASYRTRASKAGLPLDLSDRLQPLIPLIVQLQITGRVSTPQVALHLAIDRSNREGFQETPLLEAFLNQPERAPEYATSVLLTNSFLLTTEGSQSEALAGAGFNSVSQLVASQVNRYLSYVVPNIDLSIGVQGDAGVQDLDLTAGLALRLLDERLVIRGQGVFRGLGAGTDIETPADHGLQGEFVVEIRLSPSVSVEVFYRREGDVLAESVLTSTTGAGLSYQTRFSSWRTLIDRLFRTSSEPTTNPDEEPRTEPIARTGSASR